MPVPITVPRLGWSMDKGTFVGWLKQDGASVKAGEPLFTLEGDKASQEVEATESGILRIPPDAPKAGEAVSVGAVLGYLVGEQESPLPAEMPPRTGAATERRISPAQEAPPTPAPVPARAQAGPGPTAATVAISPRARRRAAELGLDYGRLKGSGRSGRIREADVLAAAKGACARGAGITALAPLESTGGFPRRAG